MSDSQGEHAGPDHLAPRPTPTPAGVLVAALGFGLVAGAVELGVVLARGLVDPRISMDMLRRNRHYLWMVPASDALIFAALGVFLCLLARRRPVAARWLLWRLPVAMAALGGLLIVEEIHPAASLTLACGVAAAVGPALERGGGRLGRALGVLPLLCLGFVLLVVGRSAHEEAVESRALASRPAARRGSPNLLLLVMDDVRAGSLGLYGHTRPTTPNLQRLAGRGVLFSEARPTAPWTLPSHASMFTGRWPHETSVGWDRPLDSVHPTLAGHLAARGYATAGFVGNTYYGNALYGLGRGFDRYEDQYENLSISAFEVLRASSLGRRLLGLIGQPIRVAQGGTSARKTAEMLNRDALGWLDARPDARPFFLFLNYFDAHAPFVPPAGPDPRFGLGALPSREQAEILERYVRLTTGKNTPADGDPATIEARATAVQLDGYESCIAYLDRQVGRLIDGLERRGQMANTLVIVTSDHGEHFRERGFFGHGLSLYRPEVHVPLLILPPGGLAGGRVVREPSSLRDLPATCVELLGLSAESPFPGRSLAATWGDIKADSQGSPALVEVEQQVGLPRTATLPASLGPIRSVIDGGEVFIRGGDGREELYDLLGDPREIRNLIGDRPPEAVGKRPRRLLDGLLEPPAPRPVVARGGPAGSRR